MVFGPNDPLNKFYSEFSMFKWIYENDKESDYIGCCHYRRQFKFYDIDYNYLRDDHCIVYNTSTYNNNINPFGIRRWCRPIWNDCEWLYFDFIDYIRTNIEYIKYFRADEYSADNLIMYSSCSFIMNRQHFFNLWKFVGGFFDYLDTKYELNHDFTKYDKFMINFKNNSGKYSQQTWFYDQPYRLFAFIGEWLCSDYLMANFEPSNIKSINKIPLAFKRTDLKCNK